MNILYEFVKDGILLLDLTRYCGWVTLVRSFHVPNSMPSVRHWVKKLPHSPPPQLYRASCYYQSFYLPPDAQESCVK
jgi:hypothetical protein